MSNTKERTRTDVHTALAALMPSDPLLHPAWMGCLHWAIGNEKVLAWFKSETGSQYLPPRSAIERMIDEATGADTAFILKFAAWMTENIWGAE